MSANILQGPPDSGEFYGQSLGVMFYNALSKWEPGKTLLVDANGDEISYGNFLKMAVKLARQLTKFGIKKGDVISVVAQNSGKYLVTIVAGFFIGAAVNLLNHDYTTAELEKLLSICKPVLIFCTKKTVINLKSLQNEPSISSTLVIYDDESTPEIKSFDDFLGDIADEQTFHPVELNPKEETALIITSSGTTGFPKCVELTHANFRVTMLYVKDPEIFDINEKETLIGFLPFFHVFGLALGLAAAFNGSKLIVLDKFIPDQFLNAIQEHKITKLFAVPPILLFLVKSPLVKKYDLSSISDVIAGAAPVTVELEEAVEKLLNVSCVRQLYGTTEVCGAAAGVPKNVKKSGSCGKVIMTFTLQVCDVKTGQALPPNEVGELRFKGDGVMKGYLGNVQETEDSFDENGYMRSGDLGYYDEEGYVYIIDRLKELIKYKGFQVAPAELESLLVQHPAVKDAGVVGKPDERAGEVPVAFVVKQPNATITEEQLIAYVAENVSLQKHLYGGVRFIDEIPKNASGKILRRKLREMVKLTQ